MSRPVCSNRCDRNRLTDINYNHTLVTRSTNSPSSSAPSKEDKKSIEEKKYEHLFGEALAFNADLEDR